MRTYGRSMKVLGDGQSADGSRRSGDTSPTDAQLMNPWPGEPGYRAPGGVVVQPAVEVEVADPVEIARRMTDDVFALGSVARSGYTAQELANFRQTAVMRPYPLPGVR